MKFYPSLAVAAGERKRGSSILLFTRLEFRSGDSNLPSTGRYDRRMSRLSILDVMVIALKN